MGCVLAHIGKACFMRVMIYTPVVLWPVHFETDLEIARRYLDDNWEVTFLQCRRSLPVCTQNRGHIRTVCYNCMSRYSAGITWLGPGKVDVQDFLFLAEEERKAIAYLAKLSFTTVEEVRAIVLDGVEVGVAALSTLITLIRTPQPDVVKNRALIIKYLQAAATSFYSVRNQIRFHCPDAFVLFNGRFAELFGALRAAQGESIALFVHERSGVLERYSLTPDVSPHDLSTAKRIIEEIYAGSVLPDTDKQTIASGWYDDRRAGKSQSWYSFSSHHQSGLLPPFSPGKLKIAIFNSSEDEMEAFEEWKNPLYASQTDGLRLIISFIEQLGTFQCFLRIHPNLAGFDNAQTRDTERLALDHPTLTVIAADSPVSSYELIDACDLIITFGSTVGIEAAFAGKHSVLLGRSQYESLGCCSVPSSHVEFIILLSRFAKGDTELFPDPVARREGAIKYGFYYKEWGHLYRYVKPVSVVKSVMLAHGQEVELKPAFVLRLINLLYSVLVVVPMQKWLSFWGRWRQ